MTLVIGSVVRLSEEGKRIFTRPHDEIGIITDIMASHMTNLPYVVEWTKGFNNIYSGVHLELVHKPSMEEMYKDVMG